MTATMRNKRAKKASKKAASLRGKKPKKGLVDAMAMHRKHPKTFEVPSKERMEALEVGDLVKAAVKVGGSCAPKAERMWFRVEKIQGNNLLGKLGNEPGWPDVHGLKRGDTVVLQRKHLYDTQKAKSGGWFSGLLQSNPGSSQDMERTRNKSTVIHIGPTGTVCAMPGKLTSKERYALPNWAFALPGKGPRSSRRYPLYTMDRQGKPVPSRTHAINARGRAKQQFDKRKLSKRDYETVVAKAKQVEAKCAAAPVRAEERRQVAANPQDESYAALKQRLMGGGC